MNLPLLIVTVCLQGAPCATTITAPAPGGHTAWAHEIREPGRACKHAKDEQELLLSRVIKLPSTFQVECKDEFVGRFQPGGK